jgi:hypothetical protein
MKNLNLQSRLNWEWDGWSVYFIDIRLYLTLDHSYWSSPQSTPTVRSEIHSLLFQFRAAQTVGELEFMDLDSIFGISKEVRLF